MSWLAKKSGGLLIRPGVYIDEDYSDDHTPATVGLNSTLVGGGGVLTQTGAQTLSSSDVRWATYSPYVNQRMAGDFDFEIVFKTRRSFSVANGNGIRVLFTTPDATDTYKYWYVDTYVYNAGVPWRAFRVVANGTVVITSSAISSAYDAVTEMTMRITRRSGVLVIKLYRTSDMLELASRSVSLNGMYTSISQFTINPQTVWIAGSTAWLKSAKLTIGGQMFPAGI
jgi:hypothetical protein